VENHSEVIFLENPSDKTVSKLRCVGRVDGGADITFISSQIVIPLDGLSIKEAQAHGKSKFKGCRVNISFESPNLKKLVSYPVGIIESDDEKVLLGNELKIKQNIIIKPSLNLYHSDDYDYLSEDNQFAENDISKEIKSHPKVIELREINSKLKFGDRNALTQ
jgi:hypothetical protein